MPSILGLWLALAVGGAFAQPSVPYLFDVLDRSSYRQAWDAMFVGEANVDRWLARYARTKDGPATPGFAVVLGDTAYQRNKVCKAHDCGDNQFFVLFAPEGSKAWGLLLKNGREERFFGHPDEAVRDVLRATANQ